MLPLYRARPHLVAFAVAFFALGLLGCLVPLFGGPGYEQSLASGLILPSAAAVATALELSRRRDPPLRSLLRGMASGLALAAVAFATSLLHGVRLGFCDAPGGALGFVLTAGLGSVLGGAWGACVGELARGRRRRRLLAVGLALVAPALGILVSFLRFYSSPMIFAFDPFFGYFSGTLYDTVIDAGQALVTYRMGTLSTLVAGLLVASALGRTDGRIRALADSGSRARLAAGVLLGTISPAMSAYGSALGHWQTTASIARDLGGLRAGERCTIVYPDTMREDEVALLLTDCSEELGSVERALDTHFPDRVTAIFFRDAADKKRLMGAADTYIAKPWRREVYLQVAAYPHPVLGHELAHVVAGGFGRGPFRIAGSLGGWLPNPGLIEGVAVAAAPDDDELTDREWVHALLELGTLPRVRSVFSLEFLGASAAKSYTVAGAFVSWIKERWGAEKVRLWYGGASIESLTGQSWDELDASFRAEARKTRLSPDAEAYAKGKFEHPAVFGRRCPHVVDALRRKADGCREAHQVQKALDLYDRTLRRDPHDAAASYGRALTLLRNTDAERGRADMTQLADEPDLARALRDRALDALADTDLLEGRADAAASRYRTLAAATLDEDFGRTEEVKALASADPLGNAAIIALLVGAPARAPDLVLAAAKLGQWVQASESALPLYLLGRNLAQRGWLSEGSRLLERALATGDPVTARIGREILRQRAVTACAMGDVSAAARVRVLMNDPVGPYAGSYGRRASLARLLDRCAVR